MAIDGSARSMMLSHTRKAFLAIVLALPLLIAARSAGAQSAAELALRISTLEEQLRQLNGQVETLTRRVQELEAQAGSGPAAGQNGVPMDFGVPEASGPAPASQPQILGEVPATGRPLDLSGAIGGDPAGATSILAGEGQTTNTPDTAGPGQGPQALLTEGGDPQADYDAAYGYILRGEFQVAERAFTEFLTRHSEHELAGNAQYWLGEALFATGRYRDAADAFLAGYTDYPQSPKAPDSLYKLGMSLKELGQVEAACATFAEISRTFPNAPQTIVERTRAEMEKSGC